MAKKKAVHKSASAAPRAALQAGNTPWWKHRYIPHALFLLGTLLYANTWTHDYTLDDAILIYENTYTRQGVAGIPGIFSHDTFQGFFNREGTTSLVSGGRYRPLTHAMFAIEYSLFGDNPFWGHLINTLLYGLSIAVFFVLLRRLFAGRLEPGPAQLAALAAAFLFAVHPLHTEVVANIKGRDEIMVMLLSLGSWWCWFRYLDEGKAWKWMSLSAVLFMGALLSKEHAITMMPVMLLGMWVFQKISPAAIGRWSVHWVATAVVFLLIRGSIIGWSIGEPPMELMNNPFLIWDGSQYIPMPAAEKWATIVYTLGLYLKLLFVPWPLIHDYYPRHIEVMTWAHPAVILSLAAHIALAAAALWLIARRSVGAWVILLYAATLSLASNILFPVGTNMSERFLYLPSMAPAILAGWWLARLYAWSDQKDSRFMYFKPTAGTVMAIGVVFAMLTLIRNPVWKDNYTLFTTDVEVAQNSAKLRNAAGGETIARAMTPEYEFARTDMLKTAIGHLNRATEIHPTYKNAWLLLGNAHYYLRQYEQAIEYYHQALAIDPNYAEAIGNLSIAYRDGGRYFGEQLNDLGRALQYLNEAQKLRPGDYETQRLLGVAYGVSGNHGMAITHFRAAAELNPKEAEAWMNLSMAHRQAGQEADAERYRRKALELDPNVRQ